MAVGTGAQAAHTGKRHHEERLEHIRIIREALRIGLESFSEIERLTGEYEAHRRCSGGLLGALRPIHPAASAGGIEEFATALRTLEVFERETVTAAPNFPGDSGPQEEG